MSFNSKYTGVQIEELLGKIPVENDIWHSGNDGSGSGLDADLLDGYDSSKFYREQGRFWSSYATSVLGNGSFYAQGYSPVLGAYTYGSILNFKVEDKITQFYITDGAQAKGTGGRLFFRDQYNASDSITSRWIEVITSENIENQAVASATKLQTARTIWGQSFDGTGNVIGNLTLYASEGGNMNSEAGKLCFHGMNAFGWGNGCYITGIANGSYGRKRLSFFQSNELSNTPVWSEVMTILPDGNVGIGTTNPSYKLDVSGGIHASGSVTQNSDINLKNISKDILISLDDISEAPLFEFTYKNDENKRVHVGTSAQYWVEKNNWFCKKQDNGYYDMEIQNLALASAISIAKEFKKYKEESESTINNMKKEIEKLKQLILNMNK